MRIAKVEEKFASVLPSDVRQLKKKLGIYSFARKDENAEDKTNEADDFGG